MPYGADSEHDRRVRAWLAQLAPVGIAVEDLLQQLTKPRALDLPLAVHLAPEDTPVAGPCVPGTAMHSGNATDWVRCQTPRLDGSEQIAVLCQQIQSACRFAISDCSFSSTAVTAVQVITPSGHAWPPRQARPWPYRGTPCAPR